MRARDGAKGLTSSYVPLGAVAMRPHVAAHFGALENADGAVRD
jgi:adenosylmethionine-8-amino-7-oxononanoate aminotransferase